MIRIYSEAEIKLQKRLRLLCLLFSVLLPAAGVFLLNGGELLIFYHSEVYEIAIGSVAAQILSILNSIISSALFMCSLVTLCASIMTFGVGNSKLASLFTFLSQVITQGCSIALLYILVYTGNHDYTPSSLKSEISVIFDVVIINIFIYFLVILAFFILFYFSSGIKSETYAGDRSFIKKAKTVYISIGAIKVVSYIFDVIFTSYPDEMTVNIVMSDIVLPLVYIALELAACYFALRFLISYLDKLISKWNIELKNQWISEKKKESK